MDSTPVSNTPSQLPPNPTMSTPLPSLVPPPDQSSIPNTSPSSEGFSIDEAVRIGWKKTKEHVGFFVLLMLTIFILQFFIPQMVSKIFISQGINIYVRIGVDILVGSIYLVLSPLIALGELVVSLKMVDEGNAKLSDLFSQYKKIISYYCATFLIQLITFGGFLFFIIPGIIWSIEFSQTLYFIIDEGVGPIEAMKRSSQAMKGVKIQFALLELVLVGITILGVLLLLIGIVIAIPITLVAEAYVYRLLQKQAHARNPSYYPSGYKLLSIWKILAMVFSVVAFCAYILFFFLIFPKMFSEVSTTSTQSSLVVGTTQYLADLNSSKKAWETGQYAQTITIANKSLTEARTNEEKANAHYWIGLAYYSQKEFGQAITEENLAIQLNPKYAAPYATTSAVYLSLHDSQQALTFAQKSATLDPTYEWAYNDMGLALAQLGRKTEGIQALQKAIQLAPKNVQIKQNLENVESSTSPQTINVVAPSTQPTKSSTPASSAIQIENGITAKVSELSSDANNVYATFIFTNNSSQSVTIKLTSITMRSGSQVTPGNPYPNPVPGSEVIPNPVTLQPGQTSQTELSFVKLTITPYTFHYLSSKNDDIVLGTYTP